MTTKRIYISSSCGAQENPEPELPISFDIEEISPKMISEAFERFKLSKDEALVILQTELGNLKADSTNPKSLARFELAYNCLVRGMKETETLALETIKMTYLLQGAFND